MSKVLALAEVVDECSGKVSSSEEGVSDFLTFIFSYNHYLPDSFMIILGFNPSMVLHYRGLFPKKM